MKLVKKFAAVFVAVICAFSFYISAGSISLVEWNEEENLTMVAAPGVHSNSDLKTAQLKVKYDYPSNRMIMLFMLSFSPFTEEEFPELRFCLNGGEELAVNLNGETEYNEEEYYLEFTSKADYRSGNVLFEVVFAIKDGIPEEKELTIVFYDPSGVPSNTYTVNLADGTQVSEEETTSEDKTQTKPSKNNSNKNNKTETKTKTEKTKKTKTTTVKETTSVALINDSVKNDSQADQGSVVNGKVLLISASAIVLAGLIISGGMHYLKRKKHKGDKG